MLAAAPVKVTSPSWVAPSSVTVPVIFIPDALIFNLVVPAIETSKLLAPELKIPVFNSSLNPSATALAEPSSNVNVPSSCNNSTHASFELFLIFKIPVLVSAQNIYAAVVDGLDALLLFVSIACKALFKSALKLAPEAFAKL